MKYQRKASTRQTHKPGFPCILPNHLEKPKSPDSPSPSPSPAPPLSNSKSNNNKTKFKALIKKNPNPVQPKKKKEYDDIEEPREENKQTPLL